MLTTALLLACAPQAASDRTPLPTRIEEVTVFPGQALVRRVGTAPAGGERLAIEGLPLGIDTASLRARCQNGEVVGLETRTRLVREVPEERLAALRARLKELQRRRESMTDERSLADDVKGHLQRLLQMEESEHARDLERGRQDPALWSANLAYIQERLGAARQALREIGWRIEDLDVEVAQVKAELERSQGGGSSERTDVWIDLVARGGAPVVELEYLIGGAGWAPLYDLRTAADAKSVDLAYRAQVSQRTGEDWTDCQVLLSTARPQLGAQGPEPYPIWVRLLDESQRKVLGRRAPAAQSLRELGYADGADDEALSSGEAAAPAFAAVEAQGLSVRYRLPRRETIQSRVEPTTVLVGQQTLEARPEYHVTPSLDLNVWLRGVATNSSPWTLLPGRASVFFGADYVGAAELGLVQPGAELVLHLGADPALVVERVQTEDMTKGPGLFGSRETQSETWRVTIENHGAAAAANGAAEVFVSEALPRSTDERITVELAKSSPKPLDDERWKKELEEQGVRTWKLTIPRDGETALEYQVEISYPQGSQIVR